MTKKAIIVSNGDNWEGVYIDDKLISQDHSLRVDVILEALGYKIEDVLTEEGWLEDQGYLPENLEDVKIEMG